MSRRVVWILGAGFSVPLGGPSLASLLAREAEPLLDLMFVQGSGYDRGERANLLGDTARAARWLYHYGTGPAALAQIGVVGEALWADAEDFFDKLDRAARAPKEHAAQRFEGIVSTLRSDGRHIPIADMRDAAKRLLAFECSRFLLDAHTGHEPWLPYKRWVEKLAGGRKLSDPSNPHTIITFNYDCVLERLGLQPQVVLPYMPGQHQGERREGLRIYKLHGSTNWRYTGEGENIVVEDRVNFAATCKPEELAIAAPGPGKQTQAERLQALWDEAAHALSEAHVIAILGYRMPPTDARSRAFFVDHLPRGRACAVKLVLGADLAHPDVRRLQGVLQLARPSQTFVELQPMSAQDYIDACDAGLTA